MLAPDFLAGVNYALRGTDDDVPTIGDDDANYWLTTLNRKKSELFKDVTKLWRFAYKSVAPNEPGTVATSGTTALTGTGTHFTDYNVGDKIVVSGETVRVIDAITDDTHLTVTVAFANTTSGKAFTHSSVIAEGVQSYNLHRSFLSPSDKIYVLKTDGHKVFLTVIQPQEDDRVSQKVYISGGEPEALTFTAEISDTDSMIGGVLCVPGYYEPDDVDITDADAIIPLPDPYWGVMATAAEIAGNDIVYEDKEANLTAKVNNLFSMMSKRNRRGTHGNPRKTPTVVKRIRGY